MDAVRNMQVAEDLHEFRLTSNVFVNWHRYVCKQNMIEMSKMKLAEKHYNKYDTL